MGKACLKSKKEADSRVGCRMEGQIAQIEAGLVLKAVTANGS